MSKTTDNTIALKPAIKRGDGDKQQVIESVTLRDPSAGELRGLALTELLQMDVASIIKLIPRISTPPLTEAEVTQQSSHVLTKLGLEVVGFLGGTSISPSA